MEDEAVTIESSLWLEYQIAKAKLDKQSWKQGWAKSGVTLSTAAVKRDFVQAQDWFKAHPEFISPEIQQLVYS